MAKLEGYSNLSKLQEDLWKKNFCFGNDLALSVYAKTQDWTYKSGFAEPKNSSTTFGSAYLQYKTSQFLLKQQFTNAPLSKTTAEYIHPSLKDLKLKAEIESTPSNDTKRTLSAEYTHQSHKTKLALINLSDLKLSSVFGVNNIGAGLDFNLNLDKMRLTGYNAALWVFKSNWRGVLRHISTDKKALNLGDIVASFYFEGANKDFEVGLACGVKGSSPIAELAVQKKLEAGKVLKARINEGGLLGLALRTKLNDSVTLVAASQFNVIEPSESFSYGLRIKLNQ